MALLKHLKSPKDGLPDPTGSLATEIPSSAIVQANREVRQLRGAGKGKRGPYKKHGNIVPLTTGNTVGMILSLGLKLRATHVTMASLHFSAKLGYRVRESSVQCIKKAYLEEIKKMRVPGSTMF